MALRRCGRLTTHVSMMPRVHATPHVAAVEPLQRSKPGQSLVCPFISFVTLASHWFCANTPACCLFRLRSACCYRKDPRRAPCLSHTQPVRTCRCCSPGCCTRTTGWGSCRLWPSYGPRHGSSGGGIHGNAVPLVGMLRRQAGGNAPRGRAYGQGELRIYQTGRRLSPRCGTVSVGPCGSYKKLHLPRVTD